MKKLSFTILLLLALVVGVAAQPERGKWSFVPMVGDNLLINESLEAEIGVMGGVGIDWQATNRLAMSSGVFYSYERFRNNDVHAPQMYSNVVNTGWLEAPLLVNLYICKNLALKAGVQANLRLHSSVPDVEVPKISTGTGPGNSGYYSTYSPAFSDIRTGSAMHQFYFSLPVGISYEYNRMVFDLRYVFGLQNLRMDYESEQASAYSVLLSSYEYFESDRKLNKLQLTVGYRF